MTTIIIAQISILWASNTNINPIIKNTLIIHLSEDIFRIYNNKSLNNILWIRWPKYIKKSDKEIIVRDIKKQKEYKIVIHKQLNSINEKIDNIKLSQSIHKQEEDIKIDIINNFDKYFPNIKIIKTEYNTPYWLIDILWINNKWEYIIIELKKRSTDLNTIDQVSKYWDYFIENNKICIKYVVWIKNNWKNKEYALKKNVNIIDY